MRKMGMAVAVLAVFVAACSDSTGPSIPAALVGSWVAEPACLPECGLTIRSVANPADSVAVTGAGLTTQLTIGAGGSFQLSTIPAVPGAGTLQGTVRVEGNRLVVVDGAGNTEQLDFTVSATTLTLEFDGQYDFNGDGTQTAARARGVFRKR